MTQLEWNIRLILQNYYTKPERWVNIGLILRELNKIDEYAEFLLACSDEQVMEWANSYEATNLEICQLIHLLSRSRQSKSCSTSLPKKN